MRRKQINYKTVLKDADGVTFVEALVTLVIVSTGFLAFTSLSGTLMDTNSKSTQKSIATTLAQQKIENIIAIANDAPLWDAHALANPSYVAEEWVSEDDEYLNSKGETSGKLKYKRSWAIMQEDTVGPKAFLYNIKVNVSWEQKGTQTITLLTRLSDKFG
jgi:Tfp pilus assembly protein PilV